MGRPEDLIQDVCIFRILLQPEQTVVQLLNLLERFLQEDVYELGKIDFLGH